MEVDGFMFKNVWLFTLLFLSLFLLSCGGGGNFEESETVEFTSFEFLKEDNPNLKEDIILDLHEAVNGELDLFFQGVVTDTLVARFTGTFEYVLVNDELQLSGKTKQDFNKTIAYKLYSKNGEERTYTVMIRGYNGIPIIKIETNGRHPVLSKTEYIGADITIKNIPQNGIVKENGKIRGRGNATFGWDKKPYKINFSKTVAPFGFPANKEWVLLAMWNDKSFLRESVMADVSRRIGEPFTINTQYVDLFLNDDYRGTYLFVDHIEKGDSRINVSDDGFIIENDSYYLEEPEWFTSHCGYHYTFKYPKNVTEENTAFIKNRVDAIEKELLANSAGVFDLIDVDSFARFFVVNELLANWDPNLYYYLPSRDSKLRMGPLWDFEWSLGLAENGNPDNEWGWFFPPKKPSVETKIWENKNYFSYLIKSSEFKEAIKSVWNVLRSQKEDILRSIILMGNAVQYSQKENYNKWAILGTYTSVQLVAFDTWEEEVKYVHDYLAARFDWLDTYINAL